MLLRSKLDKARKGALMFFNKQKKLGKKSSIYKNTKKIIRKSPFTIKYSYSVSQLNDIRLFYNDVDTHYAETDSNSIYLNVYHDYTDKVLLNTLTHEAMHFIIYRNNKHYLPEKKEHIIMEMVNPELIYII